MFFLILTQKLSNARPILNVVAMEDASWAYMAELIDKWDRVEIPGQSYDMMKDGITKRARDFQCSYFHCLTSGLNAADRAGFLQQIMEGSLQCKNLRKTTTKRKQTHRMMDKLYLLTNLPSIEKVRERYPQLLKPEFFVKHRDIFNTKAEALKVLNPKHHFNVEVMNYVNEFTNSSQDSSRPVPMTVTSTQILMASYETLDVTPTVRAHVYCDDCKTMTTVHPEHTNGLSLVIADPPFGLLKDHWDKATITESDLNSALCSAITKRRGGQRLTYVVFCSPLMLQMVNKVVANQCEKTQVLFWKRYTPSTAGKAHGGFANVIECIVVGFIKGDLDGESFPSVSKFINFENGSDRSNLIEARVPQRRIKMMMHSGKYEFVNNAQKPVYLMKRIIEYFSNQGDTVLDLYAGTGKFLPLCCGFVCCFFFLSQNAQSVYFNFKSPALILL
jgi:hypothetical protein